MERDEYVMFIDETGTASPNDLNSNYYVVAGCIVTESEREKLRNGANNIKFKYWNRTDIIFHSREMGRKEGDFSILGNTTKFKSFLTDLEEFLVTRNYYIFAVVVDKVQAKKLSWDEIRIYKDTSSSMTENFLLFLYAQKARGKIVIESATSHKDFYFHRALGSFLSAGIKSPKISHEQAKDTLTSISFVTKNNYDTEEQIADLFAYAAKCEYMRRHSIKFHKGLYEEMMLRVLKKKLITPSKIGTVAKPKYLKNFNALKSFP